MRAVIHALMAAAVLVAGCSGEYEDEDGRDSELSRADDGEECSGDALLGKLECPVGFAPMVHFGMELSIVDVTEDVVPVCGGRGIFLDGEAHGGADWVGVQLVERPACTLGCFLECGPGLSLCGTDGGHVCSEIGRAGCADFVEAIVVGSGESCE